MSHQVWNCCQEVACHRDTTNFCVCVISDIYPSMAITINTRPCITLNTLQTHLEYLENLETLNTLKTLNMLITHFEYLSGIQCVQGI